MICLVRNTSRFEFLSEAGADVMISDILDEKDIARIIAETRPDVVCHAAAKVMSKDERELFITNVDGTRNLCKACFASDIARFVHISSVAVVSGNDAAPLREDMPYKASNSYGRSKIEAERVVKDFRQKGLRSAILRPCMVYGEDEPHALEKIFTKVLLRRIPVPDVSGMDSKLQLLYINNLIQAIELAMEGEEALSGTFMIADEEVITIRGFLEILYREICGGFPVVIPSWLAGPVLMFPPFSGWARSFFKDRVYDISAAREKLGYRPEFTTEDGLKRSVAYWRQKIANKEADRCPG